LSKCQDHTIFFCKFYSALRRDTCFTAGAVLAGAKVFNSGIFWKEIAVSKSRRNPNPFTVVGMDVDLLVAVAAILAIKLLTASSVSAYAWFIIPGILVGAALIPTAVKGGQFPQVGLIDRQIGFTLLVLCRVCVIVFPAMFIGLWLVRFCGFELPLRPVLPQNHKWACWVFYQFMYVAVAEEVFFRGYVQNNILKLAGGVGSGRCPPKLAPDRNIRGWRMGWMSIVLSAAYFAIAHIIVQGRITSALTFLPGLVLGWLFVRTRSLLAPILFHGLANTCYCIMAVGLA
jgi:membrane protease YdiL (CAAX protease family)